MANHSMNCRHCGRDQRTHGLRCCYSAERELSAQRAAFAPRQAEARRIFTEHGIDHITDIAGVVHPVAASVLAFLLKRAPRWLPSDF